MSLGGSLDMTRFKTLDIPFYKPMVTPYYNSLIKGRGFRY